LKLQSFKIELFSNFLKETTHITDWWLSVKDVMFYAFTSGSLPKQHASVHLGAIHANQISRPDNYSS